MTNRSSLVSLSLALLCGACATERRGPSYVTTTARLQHGLAAEFPPLGLAIQEGRLVGLDRSGLVLVAETEEGGCVLAFTRAHARRYCRVDQGEGSRRLYHAIGFKQEFSVELRGEELEIRTPDAVALMALPDGPTGALLRRNPELAAVALPERYLPGAGPRFIPAMMSGVRDNRPHTRRIEENDRMTEIVSLR